MDTNFFDKVNDNAIKQFKKYHLDNIRESFLLSLFNIPRDVFNIINNDLAICCYWSDSRLDKSNNQEWSIDLLVCNNNIDLSNDDIRWIIRDVIDNSRWIVEDNSYVEIWNNWEIYTIEDDIEVWKIVSYLQLDPEYIDILSIGEDLYKYNNKYYPDRLIDAFYIGWNEDILKTFKYNMLEQILNNPSILKKFRKWIKNYFNNDYIFWKNHRNWLDDNYFFNDQGWYMLIKYDNFDYYGFKHWPMRALQYKIIQKLLELIISSKNISIIDNLPFDIEWRLNFLVNNNAIELTTNELDELNKYYNYFKDFNMRLSSLNKNKDLVSKDIIRSTSDNNSFIFYWNWLQEKLKSFYNLFVKL